MRVGTDARTMFAPRRRGTGRNLVEIFHVLPRLKPSWEFVLYHQAALADDPIPAWPNVQRRRMDVPGDRWHAWQEVALPAYAWHDHVSVLHCPANEGPGRSLVRTVVTVHDLIPLKVPGELSDAETQRFANKLAMAAKRAAVITCVSEATRDDLLERHPECAERVRIVPWAANRTCMAGEQQSEDAAQRHGVDRPFLLAFSGASKRKNTPRVIEAFARLKETQSGDAQLVIVGCEPAALRTELTALAHDAGVAPQCRILGHVPDADVPALLSAANGLVFASLYEGFGLPILDAFACETPVLTSNVSSMPEVAGDAAIYCDPTNVESIADGMRRLLLGGDDVTAMVHRGRTRAERFTWEQCALLMCDAYEAAAA